MDELDINEMQAVLAQVQRMSLPQLRVLMKHVEHEHQLATQYDPQQEEDSHERHQSTG